MDNVVKIFDNTIEYIPADKGLNYILCNELNEVFFGVYEVKIGDVVFIGESVDTIKDSPIVKIPIVIEDKEHDVLFALKKQDETGIVLNLKSLSNGRKILLDEKKIVEEAAEEFELPLIEEVVEERVQQDSNATVDIEKYKTDALRVISENFNEKKAKIGQLQESLKKFIDNNIETIKKSSIVEVDKFKGDIISSVENIVGSNKIDTHSSIAEINSLRENIETSVNGYLVDLELTSAEKIAALENLREQVNFEVSTKLDEFKVDLEQYKKTTSDEFDRLEKYGNEMSQKLVEHVERTSEINDEALTKAQQNAAEMQQLFEAKLRTFQSIADKKQKSIAKIVENKFTDFESKTKDLNVKLTQLDEKLSTKLVDYVGEFTAAVNEKLTEVNSIKDKLAVIGEQEASKLQELNSSIMEAVEAKVKDVKLVALKKEDLASLKKQLEERISTESANLKKYVASYGGGGSVAQQFAAGGIINGTLNVATGQILSGGVDLATIFSGGGGGYQTLTFTESSASLTITPFGNTVSLASLSGSGGITGDYLPLSGGTVDGNVTVIGTLSTTLLEATSANITYIDIKQYELSGFDVTGNVSISGSLSASGIVYGSSGNSDQWNTTYTTVQTNSATTWNYQGTDIKALTANWQSTYTTVSSNSANWLQTISFNESTAILSISNGNSVSLSALSGAAGITGDFLPLSGGTLTGAVSTNSDIEITDSTKGIILRSPNNTKYRITVTNAGELVTTPI